MPYHLGLFFQDFDSLYSKIQVSFMLFYLPFWAQFIKSWYLFHISFVFSFFFPVITGRSKPTAFRTSAFRSFHPNTYVCITFALFCTQKHMYSIFLPRKTVWEHTAPALNVSLWIYTVVNHYIWSKADVGVGLKRKCKVIFYPMLY